MASDTQATGAYMMRVEKLTRLPDGGVVGSAGNARLAAAAVKWMLAGEVGEPPAPGDEDSYYALLIMRGNGTFWLADGGFPAFQLFDKFAAIGSGCNYAMAAMEMGATAAEAAKIATKYDDSSSGPIRSMGLLSLQQIKKPKRRGR